MTIKPEVACDARCGVGESAHWDAGEGALYWVDITGRELLRLEAAGGRLDRWPMPGFPTATARRRDKPGVVLTVTNRVCLFDLDGKLDTLCVPEPDKPGNRLNEGGCDPQGRFWVGSMQMNITEDGGPKEMDADTGRLHRVEPDGTSVLADPDHAYGISNTLAWRDDGTLLFGDTLAATIYAYDHDPASGAVSNRRVYARTPEPGLPDGSCLDAEGFLWNARFGGASLVRYAPDGSVDRVLGLPLTNPTSCTFGGPDLRTLYVTSATFTLTPEQLAANPLEGAVLAMDVGVAGVAAHRFAG